MAKCKICGKKFDSLNALKDHHNSVHKNVRFVPPRTSYSKNFILIVVIVILVLSSLIGYTVYSQIRSGSASCASTQTTSLGIAMANAPSIQLLAQDQSSEQIGQPISSTLYSQITGVSNSTLSTATTSGITLPNKICGASLVSNGKPLVFYVGGEFCPYCAAERWSMAIALSKFGSFSNLTYMISWSDENPGFQNISTISFNYANYSSQYISFLGIEELNRDKQVQHNLTSSEQALVNKYDGGQSIPFIDIANEYTVVGAQYTPPTLSGLTWDQIGSDLNTTTNSVGASINGAAITLITAICKVDGMQPASVCGASYANINLDYAGTPAGLSHLGIVANTVETETP